MSPFVPDFDIRVNGGPLHSEIRADITGIEVVQEPNTLDHLRITLSVWDSDALEPRRKTFEVFAEGSAVEVSLGYLDALTKVFEGEVTGLSYEISSSAPPTLEVHCHSYMHRLRRSVRTKTYLKQKDSAIAAQLGRQAGLRVRADDSKVTHDFVLQYNQTDLEFLLERASRIGFELIADGKTVVFRHAGDVGAAHKLAASEDLLSATLREELLGQSDSVTVRSVDKMGKAIVGNARAGQETPSANRSGPKLSKKTFGATETVVVDRPLATKAEADAFALSILNGRSRGFVTGALETEGLAALRAGGVVELVGLAPKFDGTYYVVQSTHALEGDGYRTHFRVRRNAVG